MTRKAHNAIDLSNQKFGRWVVIKRASINTDRNNRWECKWECECECGKIRTIRSSSLISGNSKSCGCYKRDMARERNIKIGFYHPVEYRRWYYMKRRCLNKNYKWYKNHGGRGITICKEWIESFANFFRDMGPITSDKHSLERKDNDKGYYPDNCVWATKHEQSRNTRQTKNITHNGKTQCLTDWAKETGIDRIVLHYRLKNGWSIDKALTTPVRPQASSKRSKQREKYKK